MSIDYRGLCELAQDGLVVTTAEGVFEFCNRRFATFTARTPPDIVGRSYLEFVHPDDAHASREEVDQLNLGLPTFSFRNRWKHVTGDWIWLAWIAVFDRRAGRIYAMCQQTDPPDEDELE